MYSPMEHMGLDSIERTMMKTMLVSACLLGVSCRWHAKKIAPSKAVERFLENHPGVQVIPVCPEELGGLPTPRPPVKTVRGRVYETVAEKELRASVTGKDVTDAFVAGAEATLAIAKKHRCKLTVLCARSPSCAKTGITGKLLEANGIAVINLF